LFSIAREELPEVIGNGVLVSAALPGVAPREIDETVARPLHQLLKDVPGVREIASISTFGELLCTVEFRTGEDRQGLGREVEQIVSQYSEWPKDLSGPFVSRQRFRLFPAMTLAITGGDETNRYVVWKELEAQLRGFAGVDDVVVLGDPERRIDVNVNPIATQAVGVTIQEVAQQIDNSILNVTAGSLDETMNSRVIRTQASIGSLTDLERLYIIGKNSVSPLLRLASVNYAMGPKQIDVRSNGEEGWYIQLYGASSGNVAVLSSQVRDFVDSINTEYASENAPYRLRVLSDRNEIVDQSLFNLGISVLAGVLLVGLVLLFAVGRKAALYTVAGIPFAFLSGLLVLFFLGFSLNTLTLFGLLLVSGMIVDDAIVVVDRVTKYQMEFPDGKLAIEKALREVVPPVAAASITTVAAFGPLLYVTGNLGPYIAQIPLIVIVTLVASLLEAFCILPVHLHTNNSEGRTTTKFSEMLTRLGLRCAKLANRVSENTGTVILVFVLAVSLSFVVFKNTLEFDLFPDTATGLIEVFVEFDASMDIKTNSSLLEEIRTEILNIFPETFGDIVSISGWQNQDYRVIEQPNKSMFQFFLRQRQTPEEANLLASRIMQVVQKTPSVLDVKKRLVMSATPAGKPDILFYLFGDDEVAVGEGVNRIKLVLEDIPAVIQVRDTLRDGRNERVLIVDPTKIASLGLTASKVAGALRSAVTGIELRNKRVGDELTSIQVRMEEPVVLDKIVSERGQPIPLSHFGRVERRLGPRGVTRSNGERYYAISADVDKQQASVFTTQSQLDEALLKMELPPGISFEQRGAREDSRDVTKDILGSFVISLILIYMIIVILLRSYIQPLIILIPVPLAFIGVALGFALSGKTMSLFGLIGTVGLLGITINNSLVWLSHYNLQREKGRTSFEASADSTVDRFPAIMITTLTTVVALLPTSLIGDGSVATAVADVIVFGLLGSSSLLFFALPIAASIVDRIETRVGNGKYSPS